MDDFKRTATRRWSTGRKPLVPLWFQLVEDSSPDAAQAPRLRQNFARTIGRDASRRAQRLAINRGEWLGLLNSLR